MPSTQRSMLAGDGQRPVVFSSFIASPVPTVSATPPARVEQRQRRQVERDVDRLATEADRCDHLRADDDAVSRLEIRAQLDDHAPVEPAAVLKGRGGHPARARRTRRPRQRRPPHGGPEVLPLVVGTDPER